MFEKIIIYLFVIPLFLTIVDFWLMTVISIFKGKFQIPRLAFIKIDDKELVDDDKNEIEKNNVKDA